MEERGEQAERREEEIQTPAPLSQLIEEARKRAKGKIIGMVSRVYPAEYGEDEREVKIEVSFDTYLSSRILIGSYLGISLPVSRTLMLSRIKAVTRQDILSISKVPSLFPQENVSGLMTPLVITVELLSEEVEGEVVPPSSPIDPQSPVFLPSLDFIKGMLGIPEEGVRIGKVVEGYREIEVDVKLSKEALKHHVLVVGTTGAGKTNLLKVIMKNSDTPLIVFDIQGDYIKPAVEMGGSIVVPVTRDYEMGITDFVDVFLKRSNLSGYKISKVEGDRLILSNGKSSFNLYLLGFRLPENYKLLPDVSPYFSPQGGEFFKIVSENCVGKNNVIDDWEDNCREVMEKMKIHRETQNNIIRSVYLLSQSGIIDVSFGKGYYQEPNYEEIMKSKAVVDLRWALERGVDSATIASFLIINKIFKIIDDRYKKEGKETEYLMIFDEAHEYFPQGKREENKEPLERLINKIMRLGRVRGIGTILATHRPTDLNDLILTLTNTKVAMRADEDALKRIGMEKYSKVLSVSPPGFGIISSYTIKVNNLAFRSEKY
ncbi:ATP-binding protein [Saccharolobus islandicus]|nr:ATP-binding protein [Sulfolobus islandicus]